MRTANTAKLWGVLAGVSGALAVAVSAWASHGLVQRFPPELLERALTQAQSATHQHLLHSLALLGVALWSLIQPGRWLNLAGAFFLLGIALFSVGIYVLHLWWPALGNSSLRYAVPLGGVSFILGWLALALAAASAGTGGHRGLH